MIFHVFANRSNIGDWLSAKGIQKLLLPHKVTECLCDRPFIDKTFKLLNAATENDLIIIGGGGLLMKYFTPFWKKFQNLADRVPFCIWGIGYCDLKNKNSLPPLRLIEDIINKSKICIVRDELTRSYLSNCTLPSPVPCPSINEIKSSEEKGEGVLHVVNMSTVGLDIYNEMAETSEKFAVFTGRPYREVNNHIRQGSEPELARILSIYEKSDIVICSALHGCIIAAAMGSKVMAVSGDRKIESFMEMVGLKNWVIDDKEIHLLSKSLNQINMQSDPVSEMTDFRKKNEDIATFIKENLILNRDVQE